MALGGGGGIRQEISLVGDEAVRAAFDRMGAAGRRAFDNISGGARRASEGLDGATGSAQQAVRTFGVLRTGLAGISGHFTTIISGATALKGALAGFLAFEAIRKTGDAIGDVARNLTEIRNIGTATGFAPTDIKVFQEALEDAGLSTDSARQALTLFSDKVGEARTKVEGFRESFVPSVATMRGAEGAANGAAQGVLTLKGGMEGAINPTAGFTKVIKGAGETIKDFSDPFKVAQVNLQAFPKTTEGTRDSFIALAKRLQELKKEDANLATATGVAIWGRQWSKIAEAVAALGEPGHFAEIREELEKTGRLPTEEAIKRTDEYNLAWRGVEDAIESAVQPAAIASFPAIADTLRRATAAAAGLIEKFKELSPAISSSFSDPITAFAEGGLVALHERQVEQIKALWATVGPLIVEAWNLMLSLMGEALSAWVVGATETMQAFTTSIENAAATIRDALGSALEWVRDKIAAVGSALGGLLGASGAIDGAVPGLASGGYIRGPGTGTSDSIMARLSNGEFVVRSAAVDHFGPQFFAALNALRNPFAGFSLGGIVDSLSAPLMPPMPRFATGGLVTAAASAGGGTTVILNLDGKGHRLTTDDATGESLIRLTRKRAMLSAGRIPRIA